MRPRGSCALESTLDMDVIDQIPVLIFHVLEADITQNASVVEEDIDAAEVVNGGLNDALAIFNAVVVGDCLTTSGFDLVDDQVRSLVSS
jgi:hypothetical protein